MYFENMTAVWRIRCAVIICYKYLPFISDCIFNQRIIIRCCTNPCRGASAIAADEMMR